jgi:hypothetical protein
VDCTGRTIFVADVHHGDGKRFIVRADEKLTAFVEPESAILGSRRIVLKANEIFSRLDVVKRI